jgi:hypothetical protein
MKPARHRIPGRHEESASPAYAPQLAISPGHHAQTGKGQRYLFVFTTLTGRGALAGGCRETE